MRRRQRLGGIPAEGEEVARTEKGRGGEGRRGEEGREEDCLAEDGAV